jgi:formiminoglutamase
MTDKQPDTTAASFAWQGRIDREDPAHSRRVHQQHLPTPARDDFQHRPVLLGFACDEGVRRNQGVPGAALGPNAIRSALANLTCPAAFGFYDLGDTVCHHTEMEQTQQQTADVISRVLKAGSLPVVLGGGHELGWASFLGAQQFLQQQKPGQRLGILNFDAHFDLRNPEPVTSSGTPFRQCQQWCQAQDLPFDYFVVGLNPSANTEALYQFAQTQGVRWTEDLDCHAGNLARLELLITDWLDNIDCLYITLCLDVFPAAYAPGVSAPAGLGVEPSVVFNLLRYLSVEMARQQKKIVVVDVAEMNPTKDIDQRTAKLAARYVHQMMVVGTGRSKP